MNGPLTKIWEVLIKLDVFPNAKWHIDRWKESTKELWIDKAMERYVRKYKVRYNIDMLSEREHKHTTNKEFWS